MNRLRSTILAALALLVQGCSNGTLVADREPGTAGINWNDEIIYHVMPRSFADSNGDRHGDLNGFVERLDYSRSWA